jgi:L-2-hydroxyglutarate oxidase LhgO
MMAFCHEHGLPLRVCGKVVVATSAKELPALEELHRRGLANGVPKLSRIGPERLRELEPHSAGVAAVHVPGVAVTDYALVTAKLAELFIAGGGELVTKARATRIVTRGTESVAETSRGAFAARYLVNCAGLYSDRLCRSSGARTARTQLDTIIAPFRGEYYEIVPERRHLVRGLIYPVPDPKFPFLGVHFTPHVHGGVEVGPNAVLAFHREGYRRSDFDFGDTMATLVFPGFWRMAKKHWRRGLSEYYRALCKKAFVRDAQRLVPDLGKSDIVPGGSGVRAQALDRTGNLLDDFHIVRTGNTIHVLNVPSPAATASLLIARHIADLIGAEAELPTTG